MKKISSFFSIIALIVLFQIPASAHECSYEEVSCEGYSCTGWEIEYVCPECEDWYYGYIDATTDHNWEEISCEGTNCSGWTIFYECSICGENDEDYLDATIPHNYVESYREESTFFEAGYVDYTCSYCDDVITEDLPILDLPTTGILKIVLSWGNGPADLDSYLSGTYFCTDYVGALDVDYTSLTYADDKVAACLDTDISSGYGPETTTLYTNGYAGIYHFSVQDYTNKDEENVENSTALAESGARVDVYLDDVLVRTFTVPTDLRGDWWYVFTYDAEAGTFNDEQLRKGFSAIHDGWSFVNGNEGFEYPSNYAIPVERYKEVFGESFVATAYANKKVLNSMISQEWGGNCYGMAATSVLFHLNMLDWSQYGEGFDTVNSYYSTPHEPGFLNNFYVSSAKTSEITKLIERYQILQNGTNKGYKTGENSTYNLVFTTANLLEEPTTSGWWFWEKEKYEHNINGTYIKTVLDRVNTSTEPLMVHISYSGGGHEFVVRTDRKPQKMYDGWYRVYIYDPNTPSFPKNLTDEWETKSESYYLNHLEDDRYFELNPDTNQWRYIGGINSGASSTYRGSDEDGKVLYCDLSQNDGTTVLVPEYMFVYSLSNSNIPTNFNGTEPWLSRYEDKLEIIITYIMDFTLCSKDGTKLCTVTDGFPVVYDPSIEFYPYFVGTNEDETTTTGGRLVIPNQDISIEYHSGDDITILSTDTVISLAPETGVTIDISMDEGKFQVSGTEDCELVSQITEVYSSAEYTSVVASGTLNKDDTLSIQLNDDKLTASTTGSSSISLYTDNEEKPAEQFISVLDEEEEVTFEDVRDASPEISLEHSDTQITYTLDNLNTSATLFLSFTDTNNRQVSVHQEAALNGVNSIDIPDGAVTVSAYLLSEDLIPLTEKVSIPCQ